ncbi:MAG: di-trans,poly-cis-decaprenylcistransferase [Nitrospirae bacterium]|nr:di-trans,poly-cis-decaprenylcistransferase [Nitrospirota bacterium]
MDGNRRWAKLKGLPYEQGHKEGINRVKDIINTAIDIGVNVLTLYAFSSENWMRPEPEVTTLMGLLKYYLKAELPNILQRGVVFRTIGNHDKLSSSINMLIKHAENLTARNKGMTLVLALSYGGRDEIIRTIKKLNNSGADLKNLTENEFEANLDTAGLPPVDLIIRTSGEVRLSNFLIWQAAYAELYFTKTYWPDFTIEEFNAAIKTYSQRERRFGAI